MKRSKRLVSVILFLLSSLTACKLLPPTADLSELTCQHDICVQAVVAGLTEFDDVWRQGTWKHFDVFFYLVRPDESIDKDLGFSGPMRVDVFNTDNELQGFSTTYFCEVEKAAVCQFSFNQGFQYESVHVNDKLRIQLTPFDFEKVIVLQQLQVAQDPQEQKMYILLVLLGILAALGWSVGAPSLARAYKECKDRNQAS